MTATGTGSRLRGWPVAVLVAIPTLLLSSPASAHVEVESDNAAPGAQNVTLTFHIPNEQSPAATVDIRIFLPTASPLIGVRSRAQHGFTAAVKTARLATPIAGPDGPVVDVATEIDFAEGRITGSDEPAFVVSVRQLPRDAATLTFKTLQTYSTGAVVRWIEVAADGAAEPEHPASILTLAPAGKTGPRPGPPVGASAGAGSSGAGAKLVGGLAAAGLAALFGAGYWARTKRRAARA